MLLYQERLCSCSPYPLGPLLHIEIIELQSLIKQLDNPVLEEPDKIAELSQNNVADLFHDKKIREAFEDGCSGGRW